ncbi:MAG: sugar phosphate isomerase/epimerase [Alistipes sp.]|nr:sugar phosphate isomerase/epimerase [Alistipes sp.]
MKKILLVLLAAVMVMPIASEAKSKKRIGLQLYSVNQDMGNVDASLAKVAEAGYTVVETLGSPVCFGFPAAEFKALCDKHGLSIISTHTSIAMDPKNEAKVMENWRAVFEGLRTMGAKYCVIPGFNLGKSLADLKAVCEYFNKVGKLAKEYGLKLGYHNHAHEYDLCEGKVKWEYMIENTDPDCVFFQMDVYWTTRGGKDPVEYLKKYPERIKMLHIKDDLVIGESGKIDFEAIYKQFYKNGYKDFVVEQEMPRGPKDETKAQRFERMWGGVAKSAAYLENAKFVKKK